MYSVSAHLPASCSLTYPGVSLFQGAPQEGLPISDPYILDKSNMSTKDERGDDENVPVGSLRFQKNQAALESDMNTRRVVAGREMTGESGILSEVCTAPLFHSPMHFC